MVPSLDDVMDFHSFVLPTEVSSVHVRACTGPHKHNTRTAVNSRRNVREPPALIATKFIPLLVFLDRQFSLFKYRSCSASSSLPKLPRHQSEANRCTLSVWLGLNLFGAALSGRYVPCALVHVGRYCTGDAGRSPRL